MAATAYEVFELHIRVVEARNLKNVQVGRRREAGFGGVYWRK